MIFSVTFLLIIFALIFLGFLVLAIAINKNNSNNMNNNAKYAFYYLLSLVALIFTALSVGMIAFGIIDQTVIDSLNFRRGMSDSLKFAISSLIIATPIFFYMQKLIAKGLKNGELSKDSEVRRWLTYFILLVSSVTILGVFISIINNFLAGQFTLNFILKALSMIVISAIVFSFYFYDIKRDNVTEKNIVLRYFFIGSLSLILIAFVAAWFFVESPSETRAKRLDQNIINNISSLENAVNSYYQKYEKLPDSLEEIKNNRDIYLDPLSLIDRESGEAIVYQKTSEDSFEFCATFRTDNKNIDPLKDFSYLNMTKTHEAGYQCLEAELWPKAAAEKFLD